MDILLALAGTTGLAALVQAKPLPSEADALKALAKLEKTPDDPEANLVCGKYKAFALGHYKEGMEFLAKSSDKTLKTLAEHELDPKWTVTGGQKIGMGDEWVLAAKKFPALYRIFYDRASYWYLLAWPEDLAPPTRQTLRDQATKISASRPPGTRKGIPGKWATRTGNPSLDPLIARTGSYSLKVPHGDPKNRPSETQAWSDPIPVTGNKVEFSAYIRSEKIDNPEDQMYVLIFNNKDVIVHGATIRIPWDIPFWQRLSGKTDLPVAATYLRIGIANRSAQGNIWADDFSVQIDGKEMIKNPSFEEK